MGDYCPILRLQEKIDAGLDIMSGVHDVVKKADLSIVNFEFAITDGSYKPIIKRGPNLQCKENVVKVLKNAGFGLATFANNHSFDFGSEGLRKSIDVCHKNGLDTVGAGENLQEAENVFYKKIKGETLAVINCCEHEFSVTTGDFPGANPLNPIRQFYKISEARKNADYVVVIVHGGHEMFQLPSPRMQELYRYFIDVGADAVINHHQHCYSGYEIHQGKPIFYGLGNFCFDEEGHNGDIWNYGLMVELILSKCGIEYVIHPIEQCIEPEVRLSTRKEIIERINELNKIITDKKSLQKAVNEYYDSETRTCAREMEPLNNRYIRGLQIRGYLPSLLSKKWKLRALNYINCEAHRDKLINFLKS